MTRQEQIQAKLLTDGVAALWQQIDTYTRDARRPEHRLAYVEGGAGRKLITGAFGLLVQIAALADDDKRDDLLANITSVYALEIPRLPTLGRMN